MRLLAPFRLDSLELPSRVVMAPLTRNRSPGTVPGELNVRYYAQRASAGLIIAESAQVSADGQSYPDTPGLHTGAQLEGWRRVTDAVHARGGRIFVQLFHGGRIAHPDTIGTTPVGPSAIRPAGEIVTRHGPRPFVTPRALALDEIAGVVECFGRAAELAREAGFDGVEIHGANGYLIDQFLESGSNRRDDRYGGTVEHRLRFLLEVAEAAAGAMGRGRVGVRLSPWGRFNDMSDEDPEQTFVHAAAALDGLGVGYLHIIDPPRRGGPPDGGAALAARLREAFGGPLIRAEAALQAGAADLIAFGKLYIANPDLVERFARAAPLNPPDRSTFYGGGARGYTDYPTLEAA